MKTNSRRSESTRSHSNLNAESREREKPLGRLSLAVMVLVIATAGAVAQSLDSPTPKATWTPPPAPAVWGNVTRDAKVDFKDLIALGQNWPNSAELYGKPNFKVLIDLGQKWNKPVPSLIQQYGWDNRPLTLGAGISGPAKSLSHYPVHMKATPGNSVPVAIGFSVSFPDKVNWVIGQQLYPAPNSGPGAIVTSVSTQVLPGAGTSLQGDPRFDPVVAEEFTSRYISNYSEEAEFKSLDLTLEASYALAEAELSTNYRSNRWNSAYTSKYCAKSKIDFGWYFVPQDMIQLFPGVLEDLQSPNYEGVTTDYGTHYVWAEHRFAEFYVDVTISTRTAHDSSSFGAAVSAHYSSGVTSASFAANTQSLRDSVARGASIEVTLSRRGGPNLLNVDGVGEVVLPVSFDLNSSLLEQIPKIITEWRKQVNATNAATDDYYTRPITDFIDSTLAMPFSKAVNLRNWFNRYADFDDGFTRLSAVVDASFLGDPPDYAFLFYRTAFRFMNQIPLPTNYPPALFPDRLAYHKDAYKDYRTKMPAMIAFGQDLYDGKATLFDRTDPKWAVRPTEIPTVSIDEIDDYGGNNGIGTGVYFPIFIVHDLDVTAANHYSCELTKGQYAISVSWQGEPSYDSVNKQTAMQFKVPVGFAGLDLIQNGGHRNYALLIRDTLAEGTPVVAYKILDSRGYIDIAF